jgi:hypothetical protein
MHLSAGDALAQRGIPPAAEKLNFGQLRHAAT